MNNPLSLALSLFKKYTFFIPLIIINLNFYNKYNIL